MGTGDDSDSKDEDETSQSSKTVDDDDSSPNCKKTCDPMKGSGKYMDRAYEKAFVPCLNEAVRKGITADQNECTEKATEYCIEACEDGD